MNFYFHAINFAATLVAGYITSTITEANEDRKMLPTLAGSHLSVLMCLHWLHKHGRQTNNQN